MKCEYNMWKRFKNRFKMSRKGGVNYIVFTPEARTIFQMVRFPKPEPDEDEKVEKDRV